MPGGVTPGGLHRAVQAAMGRDEHHIHAFDIDGPLHGSRHNVDGVADLNCLVLNGPLKSDARIQWVSTK
jgi:hypothetical protein